MSLEYFSDPKKFLIREIPKGQELRVSNVGKDSSIIVLDGIGGFTYDLASKQEVVIACHILPNEGFTIQSLPKKVLSLEALSDLLIAHPLTGTLYDKDYHENFGSIAFDATSRIIDAALIQKEEIKVRLIYFINQLVESYTTDSNPSRDQRVVTIKGLSQEIIAKLLHCNRSGMSKEIKKLVRQLILPDQKYGDFSFYLKSLEID